MIEDRLFFMILVDLEPLKAKSPACGGPSSWEVSEKTILRFAEFARRRGLIKGISFNTTPEAAKAHSELLQSLASEGFELGIQPNIPGFRYPSYKYDLGYYTREEQMGILSQAQGDWEEALRCSTTNYTACCGSMTDDTPELLVKLGYRQWHAPAPGRFDPDRPDRCTVGLFPYPHHCSRKSRLLAGDMELYVVPNTGEFIPRPRGKGWWPMDLRPDRPVSEEAWATYRQIVDSHLDLMLTLGVPIKCIDIGTHNTEYVQFENLEYVCDYIFQAAERRGLTVVPCGMEALHREADRINAY